MLKKHLSFRKSRVALAVFFLMFSAWLPLAAQSRFTELNTDLKSFGVPFSIQENEDGDIAIIYGKKGEIADVVPDYTRLFETLRFLDTAKNSLIVIDSDQIVFSFNTPSGDNFLMIEKSDFNQLLSDEKMRNKFMDDIKGLLRTE